MWRSGSASPCQGEGREFESRHPLEVNRPKGRFSLLSTYGLQARLFKHDFTSTTLQARWIGREARQRPAKPYTRVRIPYPPPARTAEMLQRIWAIGAAVARFPDTEEVTGSIPVSPTEHHMLHPETPGKPGGFLFCPGIPRHNGDFGAELAPGGA